MFWLPGSIAVSTDNFKLLWNTSARHRERSGAKLLNFMVPEIWRRKGTKEERKERILWARCTLQGCVPFHLIFPNRPHFLLSTTPLASNNAVKLPIYQLTKVSIRSEISWTGHFPNPHLWTFLGPSLWETFHIQTMTTLMDCPDARYSLCSAAQPLVPHIAQPLMSHARLLHYALAPCSISRLSSHLCMFSVISSPLLKNYFVIGFIFKDCFYLIAWSLRFPQHRSWF